MCIPSNIGKEKISSAYLVLFYEPCQPFYPFYVLIFSTTNSIYLTARYRIEQEIGIEIKKIPSQID